jgi:2-keto-3-deoxy-L-rhamnonate aldolase RhmA
MGHFLPFFVRYAAHYKYDGIWFDLEHRNFDDREVQTVLALCHQFDIDCMVRPPTLERTRLYRYLEDGAAGLMIPFTSTPELAAHIVESAKFPPAGNRGIDGAGMDANFGIGVWTPDTTYFEDANRETFIVGQIETVEALDNLEAIAQTPGLDVLFIGPADLSRRLSVSETTRMTLDDAIARVSETAARHGKAWGITAGSPEQIARYRQMGAQLVPWGGDFSLMKILQECSADLDRIPGA